MNDTPKPRLSPNAVLWAGALVLAGLVVVQASRLGGDEARAEMVTQVGGFALLTADAGSDDMIVTIDNRRELLQVYKVVNQSALELFKKYELPRVFADARAKAQGRK